MSPHDYARMLRRKALEDQYTVEKLLPDPAASSEIIGFHAQQAVEKLIKAVLVHEGIEYRRTHNLLELLGLLTDAGFSVPETLDFHLLIPYAATLRYEDVDLEEDPELDREWALAWVVCFRSWADSMLGLQ